MTAPASNRESMTTIASQARTLMEGFADRTGLTSERPPVRYLWTDAFAVQNYLALWRQSGEDYFLELARRLCQQVHQVLGRHRDDDSRRGWLTGLEGEEAEQHPTAGGLRIGKKRNERKLGERYDPQAEWDRDGQYFHYLTKWMLALNRMCEATNEAKWSRWAVELAEVAFEGFSHGDPPTRLYWKMSIDLSRPLVPSEGQHDPLDGLITFMQLAETARRFAGDEHSTPLGQEIGLLKAACKGRRLVSDDPLGLGGLLTHAHELGELIVRHDLDEQGLLQEMLHGALLGFGGFRHRNRLELPPEARLAFRELGLALGLAAFERLEEAIDEHPERFPEPLPSSAAALDPYRDLRARILQEWKRPASRQSKSWIDHRNINDVMLASCLLPDGILP